MVCVAWMSACVHSYTVSLPQLDLHCHISVLLSQSLLNHPNHSNIVPHLVLLVPTLRPLPPSRLPSQPWGKRPHSPFIHPIYFIIIYSRSPHLSSLLLMPIFRPLPPSHLPSQPRGKRPHSQSSVCAEKGEPRLPLVSLGFVILC